MREPRCFERAGAWTRASAESRRAQWFYDLAPRTREECVEIVSRVRARGLVPERLRSEDCRVPSFARDVPDLRARLDDGLGFVVVRGLPVERLSRADLEIVYWGLANYLGDIVRQNLSGAPFDAVSDKGEARVDPYRVVDTDRYFPLHTDNAFLEPRAPDYLGLMCLSPAKRGGRSLLASAYTLYNTVVRERPEALAFLERSLHMDLPLNQRLPDGPPTKRWPVFEPQPDGSLVAHYLRMYIDPGMERAGRPLTDEERGILDYLDSLLERRELVLEYPLHAGEILFSNNRWTLHGRTAFEDDAEPERRRALSRVWLWRRHAAPGRDPVTLDVDELCAAAPR